MYMYVCLYAMYVHVCVCVHVLFFVIRQATGDADKLISNSFFRISRYLNEVSDGCYVVALGLAGVLFLG